MKYMGSKSKIANEILTVMLKDRKDNQYFVDLFCGGCNLLDKVEGNRIGNDINEYLISMWQCLQQDINFTKYIPKELYDEWRNVYNYNKKNNIHLTADNLKAFGMCGWVGWMASFNGRFYDGGYSGHSVNNNSKVTRDYITEQINNTLKQVDNLKNVNFTSLSYDQVVLPENSIVYCDIPYKDTKQYASSKNFNYERFYEWCKKTHSEGHTLYISEYQMPNDFKCVWEKEVTNAMNPTITKKPIEKLWQVK